MTWDLWAPVQTEVERGQKSSSSSEIMLENKLVTTQQCLLYDTSIHHYASILTLMTLCCSMAAMGYITNGPQATVSQCC